jgi:hypothetical protein
MSRAFLLGLIISLGVVSGCGDDSTPPGPDTSLYVDRGNPTATLTGFSWDPEAFFFNLAMCGGETCPVPPMVADGIPLLTFASVVGSSVMVLDPTADPTAPPAGVGQPTAEDGLWRVTGVPQRTEVPFFVATGLDPTHTGTLLDLPPEFPLWPVQVPKPKVSYLPTMTLRPIFTTASLCAWQEAAHISDNGILEAVAKYRSAHGTPTAVMDLIDPTKTGGVTIFWLFAPALTIPSIMVPAFDTTLEASAGTKYHINWAPPGTLPVEIQSERGFFVDDSVDRSGIGVIVVMLPADFHDPEVLYQVVDPINDPEHGRPYQMFPLPAPPIPGMISYSSLQLMPAGPLPDPSEIADLTPKFFCAF